MRSLLVTTIGRPSYFVKTRISSIIQYKVKYVLGVIPQNNTPNNPVYLSIISGWEEEVNYIHSASLITPELYKINLEPFKTNDELGEVDDFSTSQIADFLDLTLKIVKLIIENKLDTLILDLASGRRIMSPVLMNIAAYLNKIKNSSTSMVNNPSFQLITKLKTIIITRPTPTNRIFVDAKPVNESTIPDKKEPQIADFNEFGFIDLPIITLKELRIMKLWTHGRTQKLIAQELNKINKSTISANEKRIKKFKESKGKEYNLLHLKPKALTQIGEKMLDLFEYLYSNGNSNSIF